MNLLRWTIKQYTSEVPTGCIRRMRQPANVKIRKTRGMYILSHHSVVVKYSDLGEILGAWQHEFVGKVCHGFWANPADTVELHAVNR